MLELHVALFHNISQYSTTLLHFVLNSCTAARAVACMVFMLIIDLSYKSILTLVSAEAILTHTVQYLQ